MEEAAHPPFRLGVLAADAGHVVASRFLTMAVGHCIKLM